ncbi:acylphosphatase [Petrotoga olearia]|jgi:acylphosphatase|uniref:acylphosphatase n=2 Tax=Petrotoga olearia TaxID=156203 RepID=A0A2K1P6W8_9BACT|nr:acylphosphatase [Petrotoga olearia]PNR98509.1 acylphosphatase [Petrotoga olearia DSM 13574]RMA75226.1 acylphosphatase [Petrotoga olearia]
MICKRWILYGRVQGVGLRHFLRVNGLRLQLEGYVRNLPDGSVEVVVQGEEEKILKLKKIILQGNGFSRLEDIQEDDFPIGNYGSFHIEY